MSKIDAATYLEFYSCGFVAYLESQGYDVCKHITHTIAKRVDIMTLRPKGGDADAGKVRTNARGKIVFEGCADWEFSQYLTSVGLPLLHKPNTRARRDRANLARLKKSAFEKTGGRCIYCGIALALEDATIEHIMPVSKGGSNTEENITIACKKCNCGFGSAPPHRKKRLLQDNEK